MIEAARRHCTIPTRLACLQGQVCADLHGSIPTIDDNARAQGRHLPGRVVAAEVNLRRSVTTDRAKHRANEVKYYTLRFPNSHAPATRPRASRERSPSSLEGGETRTTRQPVILHTGRGTQKPRQMRESTVP